MAAEGAPAVEGDVSEAGQKCHSKDAPSSKPGFLQGLRRSLLEPSGPFGHSLFRKARFAMSLFSLFHIATVVASAKDIYLEKFGADATTTGLLFSLVSFWSPFTEFIVGQLQDRQMLARCFPVSRWGRRAPWLLTHLIVGAIAATVIYLPPSFEDFPLQAWFLVMMLSGYWAYSTCCIAFEAARQEIYPFKEERIMVEGLCKYACMAGGAVGGLP
ncbi:unnamed protein product, partial [Polarella glacialis]